MCPAQDPTSKSQITADAAERVPVVELLLDAGAVLASSLDLSTTMRQVAQLTVPRVADLCVIDLLKEDGSISDAAVVCTNEEIARELEELRRRHPLSPAGPHPVAKVVRSGEPELLPELSTDLLVSFAEGSEHARFMVDHHYTSAAVVPLRARDRILGAISVLRLKGGAPYTDEALHVVQELAHRAALAIDNARLFSDLRRAEARLEAVLRNVAEAITVNDDRGRVVFANQAAADLLRMPTPEDVVRAGSQGLMARFLFSDDRGRPVTIEDMHGRRLVAGESAEPLLLRKVARATGEERWLVVRSSPIRDPEDGDITYVVNVLEDITEVKRATLVEGFVAEASRKLASSMDYRLTLRTVARLAVPRIADWCAVDVLNDRQELERGAVHEAESSMPTPGERFGHDWVSQAGEPLGAHEALQRGTGQLISEIGAEPSSADDGGEHARCQSLRQIGVRSGIVVPMMVGAKPIGAITLLCTDARGALSSTDLALAKELGRLAAISVENARLYTERTRIAHTLQLALLPETLPSIEGAEIEALYTAAGELNEVGGDFYDAFEIAPGHLMLAIGDVCGKGPRAAGATALARHTLRTAAMTGQRPCEMLLTLHRALQQEPAGRDTCTVCLVVVEPRDDAMSLTVTLAGHPAPLVIDPSGVRAIGRNGTLLGMVDPVSVHEVHEELHRSQTLLMYTDGATDAGHPEHPLEEEGLREVCHRSRDLTLPALLAVIQQAALERTGGGLRDDLALLAVRMPRPLGGLA